MRRTAVVCALALMLPTLALAEDPPGADAEQPEYPGDLWEVSTEMHMQGMPAGTAGPTRQQKVCLAHDWNQPPLAKDGPRDCQTLEFKTTPTVTTWKMKCPGPPEMTGEGEVKRISPDAYTGWMKMTMPQGVMTMNLNGKKVGVCDAAQNKHDITSAKARIEAQSALAKRSADEARRMQCRASVDALNVTTLTSQAELCKGLGMEEAFCKRVESPEGFELLVARGESDPANGLKAAAAHCGKDADAIRAAVCADAVKVESLDTIGKCCPTESQQIAQRECAGRKSTELASSKYRSFCVSYARGVMAGAP